MRLGIVTAIVTAILTVAAVKPVSAEIVTVCQAAESIASPALFRLSGLAQPERVGLLALSRDERGYDILENWGQSNQRSLRADGDDILGLPLSDELVHLMVEHKGGSLEHFLFSLDEQGAGELLRTAEGDALSAEAGGVSSKATCTRPR